MISGGGISYAGEAGLPGWSEGGQVVVDDGPLPGKAGLEPQEGEELDLAPPSADEVAATANPADELPEKYWPAYFAGRPRSFLVDPQGLLNTADSRKRLGFLNYHASDSAIDLYVYVFKGSQEIPGEVREEELVERSFSSGRPAAIVYYFVGAPQRAVLYLSPALTDVVSPTERHRALDSCVMQAAGKLDSSSQFEAFLVQMSIRLYWMDRMLHGDAAGKGSVLPHLGRHARAAAEKKSAGQAKLQYWMDIAQRCMLPAAVLAGVLVVAGLGVLILRRRARYRFPVVEVEPRLGGCHAAGVGAVISFASASLSPAAQRDQLTGGFR